MIKHVYLFKLKDKSKAKEIAAKLMSLKEHIPYMYDMEIGFDFKGADNSYDLSEICTFRSMDDFKRFGTDPYHASIREYMNDVLISGVKIDYEI